MRATCNPVEVGSAVIIATETAKMVKADRSRTVATARRGGMNLHKTAMIAML
jgi:hypothetical protein